MPRTPIDYSKTVIYKIVCNDLTIADCYVGSTTDFTKRKCKHKSDCKKSDKKVYTFIRNNQGWENWSMLEIEKYPCNDNNEARLRERFWYEKLNAQLNMVNPNRGRKECQDTYYKNNVEKIAIRDKIYRAANKPEIAIRNKLWREANKEEIVIDRKEKYETNRDDILIQKQEYYILNANKIKEKKAARIQCGCGKEHRYGDKSKHIRTQFHQNYLLTQTAL
jgi:hypothetical protein